MEIFGLIDQLEDLIKTSRRLPLSGKTMVDEEQFRKILERIRLSLPEDVEEAGRILKERDEVIERAQREVKRLIAAAEEEFNAKIKESSVTKAAEARSNTIISQAQREAEALQAKAEEQASERIQDAHQYSLGELQRLEGEISGILASVRKGLAFMEKEGSKKTALSQKKR